MRLGIISFKECWEDEKGSWFSSGGFPLQVKAISSLFKELYLAVEKVKKKKGGIKLPQNSQITPLCIPKTRGIIRKLIVIYRLPYYLPILFNIIKKVDVVYIPLPGDIPLIGMLCAQLLKKPIIARYGGSWISNSQTSIINKITRAWMVWCAGGRNIMLATGDDDLPPAPGINWLFVTSLSESEIASNKPIIARGIKNPPKLVFIGRLSEEKGVAYLINALAILKKEEYKLLPELILIGDGPQRNYLECLVNKKGCENIIFFKGQLNREELNEELKFADICVQPSLTEGYSKAWLDAMASGLPVLSTDVGAARAVIGDDGERGWLVPAANSLAIAKKLKYIISNTVDWLSLRHRCRTYVTNRTLEAWSLIIGYHCCSQWNLSIINKKLTYKK